MPPLVKRVILGSARCAGINCALRWSWRGRLTIVCYHSVAARDRNGNFDFRNTVGERDFERHMDWLARRYAPVSAADVLAWIRGGRRLPPRPVLVTFDDGYRNNLLAARVLERRGIPAVVFVTTGYLGRARMLWTEEIRRRISAWPKPILPMPPGEPDCLIGGGSRAGVAGFVASRCKRLPCGAAFAYLDRLRETPIPGWTEDQDSSGFMSWEEVRQLGRRGFEIGSHTVEHPILTQASTERVNREFVESKAAIERETGRECSCLAYPNGDFDRRVIAAARAAGYKLGFTVGGDPNNGAEDPLALGRIHIPGLPQEYFEARVSGLFSIAQRFRGPSSASRKP